jgi:hypothetical protein
LPKEDLLMRPAARAPIILLFNLLAVLIVPVFAVAAQGSVAGATRAPAARFAVLADQTGGAMPGIYDSVLTEVARCDPDYILTVGDHVQGYTGNDTTALRSEYEALRAQYDRAFGPRWRAGDFLIPASGNHDITTDAAEPIWRRFFGPPTRRVDVGELTVLVVDTSRPPSAQELDPGDLRFLETELARIPRERPVIVITHKPWFSQTIWKGKRDPAHEMFKRRGNVTVLAGHWHSYVCDQRDGVTYVVCGSSGAGTGGEGLDNGEFVGFLWGTIRDGRVSLTPISLGAVRPLDMLNAEENATSFAFTSTGITSEPFPFEGRVARVSVTVRNPGDRLSTDSLRWIVPAGWTIRPEGYPLSIPAGDSTRATFDITRSGEPFPLPRLVAGLAYGRGKRLRSSRPLALSRTAAAVRARSIVVDGRLTPGEWGEARAESLFMSPEGGVSACDPAVFVFARDDRGIYLGARCVTKPGRPVTAELTERDARVHTEDCVGWFLSTSNDVIYQVYVNPKGTIFDGRGRFVEGEISMDYDWNGDIKAAASRAPDGGWAVEVYVSNRAIGIDSRTKEVRVNMRRKQPAVGSSGDWLPVSYDPRDLGVLRLSQ